MYRFIIFGWLRTQLLSLLFLLKGLHLYSFGYLTPVGAESAGMGGVSLSVQNVFAAANHQALMPWQKKPNIGFSVINRYGLKDLNQVTLAAAVPYHNFGYGFKWYNFGTAGYQENVIGLSAAHAFRPNFSVGLGANYHSMNIVNYGRTAKLTVEFSLAAKVSEQLSIAFRTVNPNRTKLALDQDERLSSVYQLGLAYKVNQQVTTLLQVEKSNAFRPDIKCGLNYEPKKDFHLRFGFASLQTQFTFGVGYYYKKCRMEWASAIHQTLGLSNTFSVAFEMGR